jgi:hypothetical protein
MWPWLRERLRYLRDAMFRRWVIVAWSLWTIFSNFATVRDNFFSAELQKKLTTPGLLNSLGIKEFIIGLLAISFVALWEGGFRIVEEGAQDFTTHFNKAVGEKERIIEAQAKQLHEVSRQLEMPQIIPEIISCNLIETQRPGIGNFSAGILGLIDPNDTDVRIELRLRNENRVKATMQNCELVIDPGAYQRKHPADPTQLDTTNYIEFGCPKNFTVLFKLTNTSIRTLANRPYCVAVTDGARNIRMSTQWTFH